MIRARDGLRRVLCRVGAIAFLLACTLPVDAADPDPQSRFALVIGNSDYATAGRLPNALNDAATIGEALAAVGFDVVVMTDLDLDGMDTALDLLEARVVDHAVVAVYFAGHGLQHDGGNFLLPVDTVLRNSRALRRETIPLDHVLDILQPAPTALVFLDACRDNPLTDRLAAGAQSGERGARAMVNGLAVVQAPGEMLISYATLPGEVAYDGGFGNSPYARALARHIATPDVEISVLMKRVTRDVMDETGDRQRPQQLSQMQTEFYFRRGDGSGALERPDETLLAAYPGHVSDGDEIALFADVPPDCAPNFLALSPSRRLTRIPEEFFTVQGLASGQVRFEISPGTRYGLVVTEEDERGTHQIGFFCGQPGGADADATLALLQRLYERFQAGEFSGRLPAVSGSDVLYHFAAVEIE